MHVQITMRVLPEQLKTLTVLFPYSAAERYLIERLRGRCQSVFVPHGLPQVSFYNDTFDYVFAITEGREWDDCFPSSTIVRAGWPEAPVPVLDTGPPPLAATPSAAKKQHHQIVFLSQLSGAQTHRMSDFILAMEAFLRCAAKMDPQQYRFNVRLRNQRELALLNPTLLEHVRLRGHIVFTTMHAVEMTDLKPDVLISSTSTGLLYAQHFDVSAIQLASVRLKQHWPFGLVDSAFVLAFEDAGDKLAKMIAQAVHKKPSRIFYQSLSRMSRFKLLDTIYL